MKLPKIIKLNSKGMIHHLALVVIILGVAVGGTAYLVGSHADTVSQLLYVNGSGYVTATAYGGKNQQQLAYGGYPVWANNQSTIFYNGWRTVKKTSGNAIYSMAANGSNQTPISGILGTGGYYNPIAWSQTALKLATSDCTVTSGQSHNCKIVTMNADGSDQKTVLSGASGVFQFSGLQWSPNGKKLLFDQESSAGGEIYVMNANGSDLVSLYGPTASVSLSNHNAWSADGSQIVMSYMTQNENAADNFMQILKENVSSKQMTTIAQFPVPYPTSVGETFGISHATWSPSSDKVAFTVDTGSNCSIDTVNPAGTNLAAKVNCGTNGEYVSDIDWSPDSTRIVFTTSSNSSNSTGTSVYTHDMDTGTGTTISANQSEFGPDVNWSD
jgi:Tol biopolymer transport system component